MTILCSLGYEPGSEAETEWHEIVARVFERTRGTVCKICGLEYLGHVPESRWLGYERHDYEQQQATPAQLEQARELSAEAYRARARDR